MGNNYAWGYLSNFGAKGPSGSLQFRHPMGSSGQLSGSNSLVFLSGPNELRLTGTLLISGSDSFIGSDGEPYGGPHPLAVRLDGNMAMTGSMYVNGAIYAKEYHIEHISALSASGDTKFGDSADDIHEFTGSVKINGPLIISGQLTASNGLEITGHALHDDGASTFTGKLTASNGLAIPNVLTAHNQTLSVNASTATFGSSTKVTASNGMRIDGMLGLGIDATKNLHVYGASGEVELRIQSNSSFSSIVQKDNNELIIQNASNGPIIFYDDSAERMRITQDGLVGIGTSNPDELFHVAGNLKVDGYILGGSPLEITGALSLTGSDGTGLTVSGSGGDDPERMDTTVSGSMFVSGSLTVTGSSTLIVHGPSTLNGFVSVMGLGNSATIDRDITYASGYNSVIYGPITVESGNTLTVEGNLKIVDISDV